VAYVEGNIASVVRGTVMKKKAYIMLAALCLLALASGASSQTWQTGSLEDALAKAKATGKLLLLDFFQEYG